tara:strand:- start:843 stop:1328 length:486 start_codon:yes stop_codon:yes gene_type:complete
MAGYYDRDRNPSGGTRTAAGTMNHPMTHHGNTAEYMASGFPFVYHHGVDMADQRIEFPFVTQWILISAPTKDAHIAFRSSQADVAASVVSNKFIIPQDSAIILPIKCIDLWIDSDGATDVSVMAGLTGVPRSQFPSIIALEGIATVETATGTNAAATVTPA